MKTCISCGLQKSEADFRKRLYANNTCRDCEKKYKKIKRLENLEEERRKGREREKIRREENPEHVRNVSRLWRENNKDRVSENKRNWNKKSTGRHCCKHHLYIVKTVFSAGITCINYCFTHCMVGNEYMAAEFCLQNRYCLVDISACRHAHFINCICNSGCAGNKGCRRKPGEEFADRIVV